jgi:hypothetical protein
MYENEHCIPEQVNQANFSYIALDGIRRQANRENSAGSSINGIDYTIIHHFA